MKPGAWEAFDDLEVSMLADAVWVGENEAGVCATGNDTGYDLARSLMVECERRGLAEDARALREVVDPFPVTAKAVTEKTPDDGRPLPGVYVNYDV